MNAVNLYLEGLKERFGLVSKDGPHKPPVGIPHRNPGDPLPNDCCGLGLDALTHFNNATRAYEAAERARDRGDFEAMMEALATYAREYAMAAEASEAYASQCGHASHDEHCRSAGGTASG